MFDKSKIKPSTKKNAKLEYRFDVGKYYGGKRKQTRVYGNSDKEIYENYCAEIKRLEEDSIFCVNVNSSFSYYLEKYFKSKNGNIENSTLVRYKRIAKSHILPIFEDVKINDITPLVLKKYFDDLKEVENRGKKLARKTLNMVKTVLNGVFDFAIIEGAIKRNPMPENKILCLPKNNKTPKNIWVYKDYETLLTYGQNIKKRGRYYLVIFLGLFTGMRKGEIIGLTWDKVDLENQIIYVEQILESGGREIKNDVKEKRYKQVPISSFVKKELVRHKEFQKQNQKKNPLNLVFPTRTGLPVIENYVNEVLNKMCDKLELPRLTVHGTRHNHVTYGIQNGENIMTMTQRVGHSDPTITLKTYSHYIPHQQQGFIDKLDEHFGHLI
jgi:integrase